MCLVITSLNKEGFSRNRSKIRHDSMHCWMSFGKMGNVKIIPGLHFILRYSLGFPFQIAAPSKEAVPRDRVQLLWSFFALVL